VVGGRCWTFDCEMDLGDGRAIVGMVGLQRCARKDPGDNRVP